VLAPVADAATKTARWIGGSGNWSDATHWDIGVVPNNAAGTTYSVIIDSATSGAIVTINQTVTVKDITTSTTISLPSSGTLVGAVVTTSGGAQLMAKGGMLEGVTLNGDRGQPGDMAGE
jgi:hypothetical protein